MVAVRIRIMELQMALKEAEINNPKTLYQVQGLVSITNKAIILQQEM
jgi:hypothetical protein